MKRITLAAAVISMLALGAATARAQAPAGKTPAQAQKMEEAMDRLKSAMSKGGSESAASAGDAVFTTLADFGRPAADDASVVRSEPARSSRPKAVLTNYKPPERDCWEVCVSWGPLHVCYTWETRCR